MTAALPEPRRAGRFIVGAGPDPAHGAPELGCAEFALVGV